MKRPDLLSRRSFLRSAAAIAAAAAVPPWAHATAPLRAPTLSMTAGPFYPDELPLDRDNDLLHYAQHAGEPLGIPLNLTGRVVDARNRALAGVRVEIWQCDANGRYHHVGDSNDQDEAFQGYGEFTTTRDGEYAFRTIRPVAYYGRTPHIHFRLSGQGLEGLTTQMFVAGEPMNEDDGIYNRIRDRAARDALTVKLAADDSGRAKLAGRFDIVVVADGRFETG